MNNCIVGLEFDHIIMYIRNKNIFAYTLLKEN